MPLIKYYLINLILVVITKTYPYKSDSNQTRNSIFSFLRCYPEKIHTRGSRNKKSLFSPQKLQLCNDNLITCITIELYMTIFTTYVCSCGQIDIVVLFSSALIILVLLNKYLSSCIELKIVIDHKLMNIFQDT